MNESSRIDLNRQSAHGSIFKNEFFKMRVGQSNEYTQSSSAAGTQCNNCRHFMHDGKKNLRVGERGKREENVSNERRW